MLMIKRLWVLALLLTLFSCDLQAPQVPEATPSESTEPSESSASVAPNSENVPRVSVQLIIQDDNNQRISGATVTLSSDQEAPQTLSTDAGGSAFFENVRLDGSYSIEVSAPGYASASRSTNLSQLATQNEKELLLGIILKALNTSISGQVVDAQGQPVANAAVFDAQKTQLTNQNGEFVLAYDQKSSFRLSVSKLGYQTLSQNVSITLDDKKNLGKLTLQPLGRALRIGIDASHHSLGTASLSDFQGLQSALQAQGHEVRVISSGLVEELNSLDVLMELSPASDFDVEVSSAIQAFVLSGRSLVVSAEWAGFSGFSGGAANQLMQPFGMQFGFDTLRENGSGFIHVQHMEPHSLTQGISSLYFYQPASVLISKAENGAQILVRTGSEAFRIASNTGSYGLVAVTAFGSGKVIALSDTSLWSDHDSDGNGTANLHEGQNLLLLQQIMAW